MLIENALNNFPLLFIMLQITCQQTILYIVVQEHDKLVEEVWWKSYLLKRVEGVFIFCLHFMLGSGSHKITIICIQFLIFMGCIYNGIVLLITSVQSS